MDFYSHSTVLRLRRAKTRRPTCILQLGTYINWAPTSIGHLHKLGTYINRAPTSIGHLHQLGIDINWALTSIRHVVHHLGAYIDWALTSIRHVVVHHLSTNINWPHHFLIRKSMP